MRRYTALVLAVCLLLLCTGCQNREDTDPPSEGNDEASEPVRIGAGHSVLDRTPDLIHIGIAAGLEDDDDVESEGQEGDNLAYLYESGQLHDGRNGATGADLPDSVDDGAAAADAEEDAAVPQVQGGETSGTTVIPAPAQEVSGINASEVELEILRLVNREREALGMAALGLDEKMQWAARSRAPEVLTDLSHTRPDGSPYYTAFDEAGFVYAGKWHGENVSSIWFSEGMYDSYLAAQKIFDGLKNSPGHYQNMTSQNFDQIGIGVTVTRDSGQIKLGAVQLFSSF